MHTHGGDQHTHSAAGHHPSGRPTYFAEHEWAEFQKRDQRAATIVVVLVTSIFCVGVALYTTIALIV